MIAEKTPGFLLTFGCCFLLVFAFVFFDLLDVDGSSLFSPPTALSSEERMVADGHLEGHTVTAARSTEALQGLPFPGMGLWRPRPCRTLPWRQARAMTATTNASRAADEPPSPV